MSDLVVTAFTPTVDSGRALRTYAIVRALAARGEVDLLYKRFGADEPAPEYRAIDGVHLHAVTVSRGPARALGYLCARAAGVPAYDARALSPELAAAVRALARTAGRGRVIADGPAVAAQLLRLCARRPVVHLSHNIESERRQSIDGAGSRATRGHERFERRLLEAASECWMVSRRDMESARAIAPRARLRYVPNAVDVRAIPAVQTSPGRRRLLFVGDFSYPPNRQALAFLLEAVMPSVWRTLPDAGLEVAGHHLALPAATDPRVHARGFVANLNELYSEVDCALVPLLAGGGSPLKFIEALAHAKPVVATSLAAAGLELVAGRDFLLADGPQSFADAVVSILTGQREGLGRQGRLIVEQRYSIEFLVSVLSEEASDPAPAAARRPRT